MPIKKIYVVLTEPDGFPIYCASYPSACHEHINDAIDMELEEAKNWVVRVFVPEAS